MGNEFTSQSLAKAFAEHRARLLSLVEKRLNPILLKRLSHEDVMQEAYLAAAKRLAYFAQNEDVPIYFKLRTILLQTLADIERKNLQAAGRDAYKELRIENGECRDEGGSSDGAAYVGELAADITSPLSRVDRNERHALLRAAVAALPENDRAIIVLRHFDGMGNAECAAALGIEPKAASIRYVRALERLQQKLMELSCFKKNP
jgi:RNA polymerase sigma-70 factor (ECF subfamily)